MPINGRINFRRILCPIDLTPGSDESLRYGIALAKAYDAKLITMHCTDHTTADSVDSEHIRKLLDEAVRRHLRLPGSSRFTWDTLVVDGDPKIVIVQEAAKRRIDLIVMRSRRRPYAAALMGSTAESVYRTAPCPVLITHPKEEDWAGITTNDIGLQRVLVAYDSSSDSELALSYGLSLAQECDAEVHLLHVLPARATRLTTPEIELRTAGHDIGFREAASMLYSAAPAETRAWCDVKQAVRE